MKCGCIVLTRHNLKIKISFSFKQLQLIEIDYIHDLMTKYSLKQKKNV